MSAAGNLQAQCKHGKGAQGPWFTLDSCIKTVAIAETEPSLLLHVPTTKKGDGKKQS